MGFIKAFIDSDSTLTLQVMITSPSSHNRSSPSSHVANSTWQCVPSGCVISGISSLGLGSFDCWGLTTCLLRAWVNGVGTLTLEVAIGGGVTTWGETWTGLALTMYLYSRFELFSSLQSKIRKPSTYLWHLDLVKVQIPRAYYSGLVSTRTLCV